MEMDFAQVLESYQVPNDAAAVKKKSIVKMLIGAAAAVLGIKLISDRIKKGPSKKRAGANSFRNTEEYQAWRNSEEIDAAIKYVNSQYEVDFDMTFENIREIRYLYRKMNTSIETDINLIAKKLNLDKKLCRTIAREYLDRIEDLQWDVDTEELKEDTSLILAGICMANPTNLSSYLKDFSFSILDGNQKIKLIIGDYYYDAFTEVLNNKYSNEIQLGIISKFEYRDELSASTIGCSFLMRP